MMQPATLDPSAPLHNTIGVMLIGVIASAVLWGGCAVQAGYYFWTYEKDPWYFKLLVGIVSTFDAIHLALISHTVYSYLITGFHDPENLRKIVWSVIIEALFVGVIGALVQLFFTWRVWKLSKNIWVTGLIGILILSCAGCGTAWVIISIQLETFEQLLKITPLTITINALSTATDVVIAASLIYLLKAQRTGFKGSQEMLNKLVLFGVNTGMFTTICAIAALVSLVASPNTLIYATFYFCVGRLYSNSLLANLNARKTIRSQGEIHQLSTNSDVRFRKNSSSYDTENDDTLVGVNLDHKPRIGDVRVTTITETTD